MKTLYALSTLALVVSAGLAVALDPIAVPGSEAGASDVYLVVDETTPAASVWEETNGLDGLQTSETDLGDGTIVPADSQLA